MTEAALAGVSSSSTSPKNSRHIDAFSCEWKAALPPKVQEEVEALLASNAVPKRSRTGALYQVGVGPQSDGCQHCASTTGSPSNPRNGDPRQIWSARECPLSDSDVAGYLHDAMLRTEGRFSEDQILGILYWHKYDVSAALQDLSLYTPHPRKGTQWSAEEMETFATAFEMHKKDKAFHKIAAMLPGRSTAEVVKQYYVWKKRGKHRREIERFTQEVSYGNSTAHKKKSHHQRQHHSAGVSAVPTTAPNGREAHAFATAPNGETSPDQGAIIGPSAEGYATQTNARRMRRAAQREALLHSCMQCGDLDTTDAYRQRDYTAAHLCSSCRKAFVKWGRDQHVLKSTEIATRKRTMVDVAMDDVEAGELTRVLHQPVYKDSAMELVVRKLDDEYIALVAEQVQQEQRLQKLTDTASTATQYENNAGHGSLAHTDRFAAQPRRIVNRGRSGKWSVAEQDLVKAGVHQHGANLVAVYKFLVAYGCTKTMPQLQSYYANYRKRRGLDKIAEDAMRRIAITTGSNDRNPPVANGGSGTIPHDIAVSSVATGNGSQPSTETAAEQPSTLENAGVLESATSSPVKHDGVDHATDPSIHQDMATLTAFAAPTIFSAEGVTPVSSINGYESVGATVVTAPPKPTAVGTLPLPGDPSR
eukprot:m.1585220 g.1585220  ORF g.1585220 m.1585220 type:complete len:646 (-) comp25322_c0_seq22:26-1963(-)